MPGSWTSSLQETLRLISQFTKRLTETCSSQTMSGFLASAHHHLISFCSNPPDSSHPLDLSLTAPLWLHSLFSEGYFPLLPADTTRQERFIWVPRFQLPRVRTEHNSTMDLLELVSGGA